ncbi:MAG: hypothetical protein M1823_000824 [Watsoniomyces obsoletus]|nr:MAG: hypothetical protein M1823_000824 [Watsoniomyces obsoletus]
MASTISGGVVLGSGAIIGITVGGSVLLFITLSLAIMLVLRSRERRALLARYRRGSFGLGRSASANGGQYQELSETQTSYEVPPPRTPRSTERQRNHLVRKSPHRPAPWTGNSFSSTHAGRSVSDDGLSTRSWPLPSKGRLPSPSVAGRKKLMPLPSIRESSASLSSSATPLNLDSSRNGEPAKTQTRRIPYRPPLEVFDAAGRSTTSHATPSPRTRAQTYLAARAAHEHAFQLQRSKSESFRTPSPMKQGTMQDLSVYRPARLSRSISLHGQDPGSTPQQPVPPLPCLLQGHWTGHSEGSFDQNVMATPTSFASASSSVINLDAIPSTSRPPSAMGNMITRAASACSQRSSGGLSMLAEEGSKWDQPSTAGLTSPSKRVPLTRGNSQELLATATRNAAEARNPGGSGAGRYISDASGISLDTLGRQVYSNTTGRGPTNMGPHRAQSNSGRASPRLPSTPPSILKRPQQPAKRAVSITDPGSTPKSRKVSPRQRKEPGSPLQDISGNQADPFQSRRPPQDSTPTPGPRLSAFGSALKSPPSPTRPVSAMKTGNNAPKKGFHRRKNCVRISNLPPVILGPKSCSPIWEEGREVMPGSSAQSTPVRSSRLSSCVRPARHRPLPPPPSTPNFNPEISPTPRRMMSDQHDPYSSGGLLSPVKSTDSRRVPTTRHEYEQNRNVFGNSPESGSPGPSITSSPRSCLPRPVSMSPNTFFGPKGIQQPVSSLKAIKEPCPPRTVHFLDTRVRTPSPEKITWSSIIKGPRTPPRPLRISQQQNLFNQVLEMRRVVSVECQADASPPFSYNQGSFPHKSGRNHQTNEEQGSTGPLTVRIVDDDNDGQPPSPTPPPVPPRRRFLAVNDASSPSSSLPRMRSASLMAHNNKSPRMEIAVRDSKNFEMPRPRTGSSPATIGLGLNLNGSEEPYDPDGFLRA